MPTYQHIERYRADKERFKSVGGSDNEQSIRRAFANCLDAYCREHRNKLTLVDELGAAHRNRPDGTVKDVLRMAHGYWEAKDTHDDLDAEIQNKFNRGYPRDNILFEDSETAVLFQNGGEAMRVDMSRPDELHRLIRIFLDYELPQIEEFRKAQQQFKTDLPTVLGNLRETIEEAEAHNADYRAAVATFLDLCRQSIGPAVTEWPTCARCFCSTSSPRTSSCASSVKISSTERTTSPRSSMRWRRPSSPATSAARPSTGCNNVLRRDRPRR